MTTFAVSAAGVLGLLVALSTGSLAHAEPAASPAPAQVIVPAVPGSGGPMLSPGAELDTRITAGAYASTESFTDPLDGQTRNDFATFSTRFYLKGSRLGGGRDYEATLDLRDKHDFFDKLDRELLALSGRNTFQVRQLSVRRPNEDGKVYFGVGRFPLWEAGSVNLDGVEAGYRFNQAMRGGLFVGFNPERSDQTYLEFNREARVAGAYFTYVPRTPGWIRHFHGSSALVAKTVSGHLDRAYLFNNTVYQWGPEGQLVGLVYLDFVPRVYLQTAYVSWLQGLGVLNPGLASSVSASIVDVIQYSRQQSVLELLAPSPYKEASFELKQDVGEVMTLRLRAGHGVRSADALSRSEVWLGPTFTQFISRHLSGRFEVGRRRDFVSSDALARGGVGFYSNAWELTLDQEFGVRKGDDGLVTHPRLTELGVAYHLSKELYATLAVQGAADERVSVFSTFFRIGYRFGSKGMAPIRDGAPPRGKL